MQKIGDGDWAVLAIGDAMRERDAARDFAARLWAATQALLKQRSRISVWGDMLQDKYKTLRLERDEVYQRGRHDGLWAAAALCNRPGYYGMRERILQLIREGDNGIHEPE